jgi:hypothetical protein
MGTFKKALCVFVSDELLNFSRSDLWFVCLFVCLFVVVHVWTKWFVVLFNCVVNVFVKYVSNAQSCEIGEGRGWERMQKTSRKLESNSNS